LYWLLLLLLFLLGEIVYIVWWLLKSPSIKIYFCGMRCQISFTI
jgi:hypothetical protein